MSTANVILDKSSVTLISVTSLDCLFIVAYSVVIATNVVRIYLGQVRDDIPHTEVQSHRLLQMVSNPSTLNGTKLAYSSIDKVILLLVSVPNGLLELSKVRLTNTQRDDSTTNLTGGSSSFVNGHVTEWFSLN
ncbi:hypothetical protein BaRGS_00038229 [Batillaria attramentaria]|uniref:Uncharacterized protein n=1 Tax=Batillaria attramentaria TaxID=370345 RepID=A0ABD0J6D8_9CAEN